jgi:hypothetical protein
LILGSDRNLLEGFKATFASALIVWVMALSGCALLPEKVKADPFGSKELAADGTVEVTFINKPDSIKTDVYIDGDQLQGTVAHLKYGKHKVDSKRQGLPENIGKVIEGFGHAVAGIAAAPCAIGLGIPIFFPLILACPVAGVGAAMAKGPAEKCNVVGWEMNVEKNSKYEVDFDWEKFPESLKLLNLSNQQDETPVIYCDIPPENLPNDDQIQK